MPSTPRPLRYLKIDMEAIFKALKELDDAATYRTAKAFLSRLLKLIPDGAGPANLHPAILYDLRRMRDDATDRQRAAEWSPADRARFRELHVDLRLAWRKELKLQVLCPDLMKGVTVQNYAERMDECRRRRILPLDASRQDRPAVFPMANLIFEGTGLYSSEMGDRFPLQTLEALIDWLIEKHDSIEIVLGRGIATTPASRDRQLAFGRECLRHATMWFRYFTREELALRIPRMTTAERVFDGFSQAIERVKAAIVETVDLPTADRKSATGAHMAVPKKRGRPKDETRIGGRDGNEWLSAWGRARKAEGAKLTKVKFLQREGVGLRELTDVLTMMETAQRRRRK